MNRIHPLVYALIFTIGISAICHGEQTVLAEKVGAALVVDGKSDDVGWAKARAIVTNDPIAEISVSLRAVYTDDEIFFLVEFADPNESRTHKTWIWDKDQDIYTIGPDREDCFVFKWNMASQLKDLSVHSDEPYTADIWFWKANRTDPSGFADDKIQILSLTPLRRSVKLTSRKGRTVYLAREGDRGIPAYKNRLAALYQGNALPQYTARVATGSRGDIRAKGSWSNGKWAIELSRKLATGHEDDIQLAPGKRYQFGISQYEIAGRAPDPKTTQPLYGAGDVSEVLFLEFHR